MMREFLSGKDDHQLDSVLAQVRTKCLEPNRAWKIELEGNATGWRIVFTIGEPALAGPRRRGRSRKDPLELPGQPVNPPAPESEVDSPIPAELVHAAEVLQ